MICVDLMDFLIQLKKDGKNEGIVGNEIFVCVLRRGRRGTLVPCKELKRSSKEEVHIKHESVVVKKRVKIEKKVGISFNMMKGMK